MNEEPRRDPMLSQAWRQGAGDEPPAALDALILAAAREQVAAVRPARQAWWRRALVPAGAFATVVVTASLVLMIEREQRDLLPSQAPLPAPAAPVPSRPESAATAEGTRAVAPAKTESTARAPARFGPPPAAAPQLVPVPPEVAPAGNGDGELREKRAEPASAASDAAAEGKALSRQRSAVPAREERAAPAAAASAAAPAPRSTGRPEAVRVPADWIEEIRRLRSAGREAEAQAQLAAFRHAYPDYPLPDDLRAP